MPELIRGLRESVDEEDDAKCWGFVWRPTTDKIDADSIKLRSPYCDFPVRPIAVVKVSAIDRCHCVECRKV